MDKGGRKINKAGEVSRAVLLSIFKAEESEKQASSADFYFFLCFTKIQIYCIFQC